MLQIVDGFVLTAVLPKEVLLGVMRGGLCDPRPADRWHSSGHRAARHAGQDEQPVGTPGLVSGTLAALTLTVAIMTVTRHQVRVLYLEPLTSKFTGEIVPAVGQFHPLRGPAGGGSRHGLLDGAPGPDQPRRRRRSGVEQDVSVTRNERKETDGEEAQRCC